MKISTHNKIYSFIERISIFFTLVLIGIFIIAGFIRFSNQKNINNPNNSIGDNVGNVVRITTCGQLHILSAIFPDYMLYVRGYGSGITIRNNYILSSAHIVYNKKQLPFINDKYYAKVIKGMSGGAVINEKGELLGVFKGGVGEPDMLGLAVNFPRIKKFLKGTPAEYK